eukprot:jgi/Ulvmu1/8055/UM004_0292.1
MLLHWTQKLPLLPRLTQLKGNIMAKRSVCMPKVDSPSQLREVLEQHNIPVEKYGQNTAKSIEKLWQEIQDGETSLDIDDCQVVRSLVVVVCRIKDDDGRTLYEAAQTFSDGRRRVRNQPLSEKMKPGERPCEAAKRGILEELGDIVSGSMIHSVEPDPIKPVEKSTSVSHSYPGLTSQYTVYRVNASVEGLPSSGFTTTEMAGDVGYEHEWEWVHEPSA